MYFVYILFSIRFKKTYVGISNDIVRRLEEHNRGYSLYTNRYKPWIVIYKEKCENRIIARAKERYFKSSSGRRWMRRYIDIIDT